jgi:hypothetical protein
MSEVTRDVLRGRFQNGDRPDGGDFTNLIDSCVNKSSDGLALDSDGNLLLGRGVRLGDSAVNLAGGLRFNGGQVQFNNGAAWLPITSGGGGAGFTAAGANAIAYTAASGTVGIGTTFTAATPPTFRFEVNLAPNTAVSEQVRFGNAAISNGAGAFGTSAQFAHQGHASNTNFALRQTATGALNLNAATGQVVSIRQGGNTVRLGVSATGNVIVGSETELTGAGTAVFQVAGGAFKNDGNANWAFTSDARVKEDVRDLNVGLNELRRVRPVRYRYNGRAGTRAGLEGVGVLGQEIEEIFPETVERVPAGAVSSDDLDDLRVFNPSALTFVLINAVKQLADKVEQLERALESRAAGPQ